MRRQMRRLYPLLFVLVLWGSASGCNVVRIGINTSITPTDVDFIRPGTTRLREVIEKLGAPDSVTDSDTGTVVTYRFLDMKYSRINFGWLFKPWSPVDPDLIISRTGLGIDAFELLCDENWIVRDHGFLRRLSPPAFNPSPF